MESSHVSAGILPILSDLDQRLAQFPSLDREGLIANSPGLARWFGPEEPEQRKKTKASVLKEYETDKWAPLLQRYRDNPEINFEALRDQYQGSEEPMACFWNGRFFLTSEKIMTGIRADLLSRLAAIFLPVDHIVELGCGYGAMLLDLVGRPVFNNVTFLGGELSVSGAELSNLLAEKAQLPSKAYPYDLVAEDDQQPFIPPGALIYTSNALMYIPLIRESLIRKLIRYKPAAVIHLEPQLPVNEREHPMGPVLAKYLRANDYNRNLREVVHQAQQEGLLEILYESGPLLGVNPILQDILLIWRPVKI